MDTSGLMLRTQFGMDHLEISRFSSVGYGDVILDNSRMSFVATWLERMYLLCLNHSRNIILIDSDQYQ